MHFRIADGGDRPDRVTKRRWLLAGPWESLTACGSPFAGRRLAVTTIDALQAFRQSFRHALGWTEMRAKLWAELRESNRGRLAAFQRVMTTMAYSIAPRQGADAPPKTTTRLRLPIVFVMSLLTASLGLSLRVSATSRPVAPLPFDRAAWLADYAHLKAELEAGYANLAWFASPQGQVDLPALDQRTLRALNAAADDEAARQAILAFVAAFHDGHFSQLPPAAPAIDPAPPEPPAMDLRSLSPVEGCATLGYANRSPVAFSLPFESLEGFKLEADGASSSFRAGRIRMQDHLLGIVRIRSFRSLQHPRACERAWSKNVGLDKRSNTFTAAVSDAWYGELADQLARFRKEGVDVVMVDVGSNTGGDDSGDWLPRMFTRAPVSSARMLMSAAPVAQTYLDEEIGDAAEAAKNDPHPATQALAARVTSFFQARQAELPSRHCDMAWVWREQRPFDPQGCSRLIDMGHASGAFAYEDRTAWNDRLSGAKLYWPATIEPWRGAWTGPTYVLTNTASHSSAEMFAALMQDQKVAKIVGTRTGGDGCGFVEDTSPVVLTHAQLRFRIPNCIRLRADGTDEVAGVFPDLPAPELAGESPRVHAQLVLEKIAADSASSGPPGSLGGLTGG